MLEDVYYLQSKDMGLPLNRSEMADITLTYMLTYAFRADRRNKTDLGLTVGKVVKGYPKGWPSGLYGIAEMNAELDVIRRENPFVDRRPSTKSYSFDEAV